MPGSTIKPFNIILLGDPAAGKATQAAFLVKKYKLYDFDMGKELSHRREKDSHLNKVLQGKTDKGHLTPTAFVRAILREMVTSIPKSKGILFDGHPKMLGEAQLVSRLLKIQHRTDPLVIYLSVPLEETVKRMHDRKGYFKGKFGKRADDSDTALKNRVRYYRKNIAEVVNFFQSKYHFEKVSGLGTTGQVQTRIQSIVETWLRANFHN
jgi:adenylate kinase